MPNPQQHPQGGMPNHHPNQPNPGNYVRQPSGVSSNPPSTPVDGPLSFTQPPNSGGNGMMDPNGGDYGQQFLPTGLNGDWQSDRDMHHRREMIQHIVKLLKQKDKNASPEWLTKLPQMVKQLEVSLYRSAPSFAAYADTSTLKHRLQQLAMEIARKTQQAKNEGGDGRKSADPQRGGGMPGNDNMRRGSHNVNTGSRQISNSNNQGMNIMGGGNSGGMNGMQGGVYNNMGSSSSNKGSGAGSDRRRGSGGNDIGSSSQHGNPDDPEWKVRIRHKQQRLLLLHHSSKCPYEDGKCKVTPYCADMKKLWKHMARCTDNECRVPHCFSSRSILSHYRKCKDPRCPACGPVRETVRKTQKNSQSRRSSSDAAGMMSMHGGNDGMGNNMPNNPFNAPIMGGNNSGPNNMGNNPNDMVGDMNNVGGPTMVGPSNNMGIPPLGNNNNMGMGMNGPVDGMMMNNSMNTQMNGQGQFQQSNRMTMPNQQNPSGPSPMPNWDGINSMSINPQQHASGNNLVPNNAISNNNKNISSSNLPMSNNNQVAQPPVPSSDNNASGQHRGDSDPNKSRHKQQRLLLLRHASKCNYEDGQCPVTPHCAEMKVLWKHIASCKDQYCKVKHCMSSRYVLSHYRRCKDSGCDICGPVRDIIKNGSTSQITVDANIMGNADSATPPVDNYSSMPRSKKPKIEHDPSQINGVHPQLGTHPQSMPNIAPQPPQSDGFINGHLESQQPPLQDPNQASGDGEPSIPQMCQPIMPASETQSNTDATPAPVAPALIGASETKLAQDPKVPSSSGTTQESTSTPKPTAPSSEDHALLECFTEEQIQTHINSLKKTAHLPPTKLKAKCLEVLKGLQTHEHGWVFASPVNAEELGLDDYFDIIKKPMDLGTIQKRLDNGHYHSLEDFKSDVILTFTNAMNYNEEKTVVHEMAKELKNKFDVDYNKLLEDLEKEDEECRTNERACILCGCEKLNFEPPVFFCNGPNCPTKRIRRNTNFYITSDKQYAWCNQCYGELQGEIDLGTTKLKKEDLNKRKNDETHEESWVQCDDCERWIHQICGLYNTRQDKENKSAYSCPLCLVEKKKKSPDPSKLPLAPSAVDIPRTKLSDWLEKDVHKKVDERLKKLAKEKAETENISYDDAYKTLTSGGPVTIRQVTSTDRKLEVRERMKARYAHKNYPEEFPYRCKCIVVFQNIDGVDVVLFALYVYEHDENNPLPNKRSVYISYLDSVHFMKPRKMRTFIYHEILISYLDYARKRGFDKAFIWACPPLKGDDYIFYAKPEDQKTPKDVRLRQWYLDMLVECQKRNIVGMVSNMYDQYFSNKKLDASSVPYFEGDYFPGEAENIIKLLEEGGDKRSSGGGKKKKKDSSKSKNSRNNGTENIPAEQEKSFREGGRDPVMQKFCDAIQGMKESFIVAFLNWKDAKPEHLDVPKEIMEYREKQTLLEGDTAADTVNHALPQCRKRDSDGNTKLDSDDASKGQVDRFGRPVRIIDDDDEEIDCEFFNTRQCFLDLCRGNHYQFDELRRAKHTSMMVLWHLQNREAPKFVQQCFACNREISSGIRHHCNVCSDFDLCDECFKNPDTNRGTCNHKLEVIKVQASSDSASGMTEEQRRERKRNIQLHITLIEHASRCNSSTCKSLNCRKMKSYLKHVDTCQVKASGGCKICKRIWTLLRIHAQQCKSSSCPIPQCNAIRKRIRQLQQKQQAMDDRRRQEMNRHYRMGKMS